MANTLVLLLLGWFQASAPLAAPGPEPFAMRVVTTGLQNPWEMLWGPDDHIWVTERAGKRVTRIDPATGTRTVAIEIPDILQRHFQDGLLGMAFGERFLEPGSSNDLYVSMTYDADPGPAVTSRLKIRRYTWDAATARLGAPHDVITGLPAGNDHIAGRLVRGRDNTLYLTIGDQGYNQLSLFCQPIHAQDLPTAAEVAAGDWRHYEGKVLRIALDGSVPSDNPVLDGVRSHVFSYGHRNPQGLVAAPDGQLYASEHGPSMDDELNLIQAGKNYGWPYVAGYQDDRVYVYANWSASSPTPCSALTFTEIVAPASVPQQPESAWSSPAFMPPLRTFFTIDDSYRFEDRGNATIAPSGLDIYSHATDDGIPGWTESALVTGLIRGAVYRVPLGPDGTTATGPTLEYFKTNNRYRDVLAAPDGRTIFLATDSSSRQNPGAVLAFTYRGE